MTNGAWPTVLSLIWSIPIAPPLLALSWMLAVVSQAHVGIEPSLRLMVVLVGAALLLGILCAALLHDTPRGGAIASLLVIGFVAGRSWSALGAVGLAIVLLLIERWRARRTRLLPWGRIHEALSILTLVMVVVASVQIGSDLSSPKVIRFDPAWTSSVPVPSRRPDIYLILVDGRGRADVVDSYGYDSRPLLDRLGSLGFDVADRAQANYAATRFSLASMLSGGHLDELGLDLSKEVDESLVYEAGRQNPTWPFLKRMGYETVAVPSGWDHVPLREVDSYLPSPVLGEFELNALRATVLGLLLPSTVDGWWVSAMHQRTLDGLASLITLVERQRDTPIAALIHLPVPHPPFAFNADCSLRPTDGNSLGSLGRSDHAGSRATERVVVDQTACVDRLIGDAVQEVVSADPGAVVIVFSDHGPEERLDWWDPDPDAVLQRHSMFFASRTPGYRLDFGDDITLVNVLPKLFDSMFGLALPIRDDRLIFGPIRSTKMLVPVTPP